MAIKKPTKKEIVQYSQDVMWELFGERDDFFDDWKAIEIFLEDSKYKVTLNEAREFCESLLENYIYTYDKNYMNMPKAWNGKKPKL